MSTNPYQRLIVELNAGRKAVVVTIMESQNCGSIKDKALFIEENLFATDYKCNLEEALYRNVQNALTSGSLQFVEGSGQKTYLIEPYFPEPHLLILGGGHIAKPLAEFGARVGFSVTVVDDRLSFANKERFVDAENVICESFEKCFNLLNLNMSTFVVIVTRGHRYDLDCLRQVLKHDTAYVGMIGSRQKVKSVKDQLLSEGYPIEKIDKVNAPIGLEIGAITPEEIAVAIIAEVISFRRITKKTQECITALRVNWMDYDSNVLVALSKGKNEPKAIVTVVSTKGSVPRKAGTKMLVWPDGRTLGSIGGGCFEGEVINTARNVIINGGFQIQSVDMTAYIAEDEGMVCGGIMQVIIESYEG